jgi:hypothetical protein
MPTHTRWPGDHGYDRMNFARASGWEPLSSWLLWCESSGKLPSERPAILAFNGEEASG